MGQEFEGGFDLLGDPIPEGFGKRGRPPHVVTDEKRNRVMVLQALGWANARIARSLSITLPTLKKHYFRELRAREEARDRLEAERLAMVHSAAREGNVAAMKEWNRIVERETLSAMEREMKQAQTDGDDRQKMGKKEAANLEAQTAGQGSEWGNDLLPPPERMN